LVSIVRAHEEGQYPFTDEERRVIGSVVKAVREVVIARRDAERPGASQARARQRAQRKVEAERVKAKEEARARVPRGAYKVPLSDLELSDKVYGHLIDGGLESLGDVMQRMALGDEALLMVNGVGVKALREVKQAVEDSGLTFLDQTEDEAEEPIAEEIVAPEEGEVELVEEAAAPELEGEPEQVEPEEEAPVEPEPETAEEVTATAPEPEAEPEEDLVPELEAEPAEQEEEDEIEAIFTQSTDLTEIVEEFADVAYDEEEEELFEEQKPAQKKRRSSKRRRRAVLLDEETGETYVVHKHRRNNQEWDEFAEDY
jgi:hypothetical protein